MSNLRQINCTDCGAGLDVLGGGRVRVHVCSYCGAELDAQDDYKVLAKFRDMRRPISPFQLGMTGQLWGADFTVIGTIGWRETHMGQTWDWADHQIFSPTHGYAWLTVEDTGHVTYTRKVRDVPEPATLSALRIETSESRPSARLGGRRYRYYASGRARITFVEGEFNFVPKLHDELVYAELLGPDRMMTYAQSGGEKEIETTHLPDRVDIFDSFGVPKEDWFAARGVHPLERFERSDLGGFARNLYLIAAVVALLLAIGFSSFGENIASTGDARITRTQAVPFTVTAPRGLTVISLTTDATNAWSWFEAELYDAEDNAVASFERGVEFYTGREGGESWSEGSRTARTRVSIPPGDYTLEVTQLESGTWSSGREPRTVRVDVRQGAASTIWLYGLAALFALLGGAFLFQRGLHEYRRWSGSDWSDD